MRAFGTPPSRPTLIGTDNLANFKIATGVGCPSRSRHFLRRYFVLKRRIAQGDVTMLHVPDAQMPADVLTKWIPSGKTRQSVQYMTNPGGRTASVMSACAEFDVNGMDAAIAGLARGGYG